MHNVIRVVIGSLAIALAAYYFGASFELALTIFGVAATGCIGLVFIVVLVRTVDGGCLGLSRRRQSDTAPAAGLRGQIEDWTPRSLRPSGMSQMEPPPANSAFGTSGSPWDITPRLCGT
jgi:hypothetical protein